MRQQHTIRRLFTAASCAAVLTGCAMLGDGSGGGAEALPDSGITPYDKATFTEIDAPNDTPHPYVLRPENPLTTTWEEPSAVVHEDRIVLFFASLTTAGTEILRAESGPEGLSFDTPTPVWNASVAADRYQGHVTAPSVVNDGGTWWMAFAFGEGDGIGLARSEDGHTFTLVHEAVLTPNGEDEGGIGSPSLVFTDDGPALYYEAWADDAEASWISRALGDSEMLFHHDGPVLTPGIDCTDITGESPEDCWDGGLVGGPEVRLATTATGRQIYRLWFHGRTHSRGDVGFAASWDGADFSRFVYNPVLGDAADERTPSNVRLGARYLLYFVEEPKSSEHGIAVAWHDADNPSSSF